MLELSSYRAPNRARARARHLPPSPSSSSSSCSFLLRMSGQIYPLAILSDSLDFQSRTTTTRRRARTGTTTTTSTSTIARKTGSCPKGATGLSPIGAVPKGQDNLAQGLPWVSQKSVFSPEGASDVEMHMRSDRVPFPVVANSPFRAHSIEGTKPMVNPGLCFFGRFGPRIEAQSVRVGVIGQGNAGSPGSDGASPYRLGSSLVHPGIPPRSNRGRRRGRATSTIPRETETCPKGATELSPGFQPWEPHPKRCALKGRQAERTNNTVVEI
jgi:hypothetical protein